jgi:hypothetical protein
MKKIWEKYYDWVMAGMGILFTVILGWIVFDAIYAISSSLDRAFKTPSSNATKMEFDFTGLESLGLTANTSSVTITTTTTSTIEKKEVAEEGQ